MPQEIEKKYLIKEDDVEYKTDAFLQIYSSIDLLKKEVLSKGKPIRQGYLPIDIGMKLAKQIGMNVEFNPVEARLRSKAGTFYLTLKGQGGYERNEAESEISANLYNELWPLSKGRRVEKIRLAKPYEGFILEIDFYTDRELIVAEIETSQEARKLLEELDPLGLDVTSNSKYKNKNLAK